MAPALSTHLYKAVNMKLFSHITFVVALQVIHSMGQETDFSPAVECALMRSDDYYQSITTSIYDIFNPSDAVSVEGYVFFYLHTKEKPGEHELTGDIESIKTSTFNRNRPTKIITHGYLNSKINSACTLPRNAFLKNGDYNVIVVDWWRMQSILGIRPLKYPKVVGYVPAVGRYVAKMINFLEKHGLNLKNTTLIGHSLGAHVMGIAGHNTNSKVGHIVGLDPAFPLFEHEMPGARLSTKDAEIVEVIHTNAGHCGIPEPIGHYDYYPNGGAKQPGCIHNTCEHARSYKYYAESISNETGFCGRKCDHLEGAQTGKCFGHVSMMGGHSKKPSSPHGIYHLKTRAWSPYAKGKCDDDLHSDKMVL